ncbi:hypothetical protein BDZ45DRAFT_500467 [Acephala macrosclerotiorum]|nr:hypothetical protein BDZ45DRAFT_500467 [Acephala macrosclerotiorum]
MVSRNPQYALLVHSLDLSDFNLQPCDTTGNYPGLCSLCGTWRDFKYCNEDMYYIPEHSDRALTPGPKSSKPRTKGICRKQRLLASWEALGKLGMTGEHTSSDPPPSSLLKRYDLQRDIPISALCHVFTACRGLKKINLSRVQLGHDDIGLPSGRDRRRTPVSISTSS